MKNNVIYNEWYNTVNNVLKEYNEMKEEMKNPENVVSYKYKYGWWIGNQSNHGLKNKRNT